MFTFRNSVLDKLFAELTRVTDALDEQRFVFFSERNLDTASAEVLFALWNNGQPKELNVGELYDYVNTPEEDIDRALIALSNFGQVKILSDQGRVPLTAARLTKIGRSSAEDLAADMESEAKSYTGNLSQDDLITLTSLLQRFLPECH